MKLTTIIILLTCLQVSANGFSQTISFSGKNVALSKVFNAIERQTSYVFFYPYSLLNEANPVTIDAKNIPLQDILEACFKDQPFTYSIENKTIAVSRKPVQPITAEPKLENIPATIDISGIVTDEQGNPLSGASVKIKGKKSGISTDATGKFSLQSVDENAVLEISFIGYNSQEISVRNRSILDIKLSMETTALNNVVVTALGIKRDKRNLTYSTQEVKGSELLKTKEPNVLNAMAGKVSGTQITSSSGVPGGSTRIVIRGATSVLGDNEALIVVDGVPINNSETGALTSGAGSSRIIDIDPATVENINVLKGAAATALYGASGARGVVIITTKSGLVNKRPVVSFSSDFSVDKGIFPEFQHKYAQGIDGKFIDGDTRRSSASWGPDMDTLKIDGKPAPKYDPVDLFFQTGYTTNNTIGVSGGNNNSGYYMSYSYYDQKGIVPSTYFKRHSFFVKYNTRITDRLSTSFQLTYANSNQRRLPEGTTFGQAGPIFVTYNQPISWNPLPIYNSNGKQRVFRNGRNNPYWDLENVYNKYGVNRFIPVMSVNYQLTKWLTISDRLGADIYAEQDNYKESPSNALNTPGTLINNNINFRQYNNDLILTANKQAGDFNLNLILGNNIFSTFSERNNIQGVGLSVNDFDNISAASTVTASDKHYLQRKVGFYAQANIDYKRFLALSLTGRYDGSSVLATENAFYPYGSVAGSFIFSELLPASMRKSIPFAKFRLSYATVGNDNVGVYSLKTPFTPAVINNIQYPYQGQAGFLLSSVIGNMNLKNERLNEFEAGIEARLFDNKIGIEASYFNRKSVDGIIPGVSISAATGFDGTTVNSAQISNKGVEVLLNATVLKSKEFNWNVTVSFTHIKNEVLSIYGDLPNLGRIIVGQPYNVFYGSRFKRNSTGQVYVDGDGLPVLDDEPGIIGDVNPDWLAGITNSISYKKFNLSFFFDIKKGGDVYNSTELNNYFFGTAKSTLDRRPLVYNGVNLSDDKPNTTLVSAQDLYRYYSDIDEPAMQDASYIKLRTLSLSYTLGPGSLKKTPFQSAAIIITGRNLWIYAPHFTSGDPEGSTYGSSNESQGYYGYAYPSTRSINFTLKFDF